MNFSEIVPYQLATYSHSGEYLAISNNKNLYVSPTLITSDNVLKF